MTTQTTRVMEAVIGGALLGTASGLYMIIAGKVAGNSGAVKACVLASTFDRKGTDTSRVSSMLFLFGLVLAGFVTSFVVPWGFEPYATVNDEWASYVIGGLFIGSGTYFANGCTSGHGLSGISRLSMRSFLATPIFMAAAALTAMIKSKFAVGPMVPFAATPAVRLIEIGYLVLGLFILAWPILFLYLRDNSKNLILYTGCWTGLTFGSGLAIGGMVRPSAISGALSPQNFDFTLWILFCTGLAFTFCLYRIAEHVFKIKEARSAKQGPYDKKLIIGSVLFGVGWGLTGMCPGPLAVGLVADFNQLATGAPPTGGPVLCLVFVILGQFFAAWFKLTYCSAGPAAQNATVDELRKALLNGGTILDVRNADEREVGTDGIFTMFEGTISAQYDRSTDTLPIKCLPENVDAPLIVHCKSGGRARMAASKLKKYKKVLCCGLVEMNALSNGTESKEELKYIKRTANLTLNGTAVFQQFKDPISSTYTYLLGDKATGECILIDPVIERFDHDMAKMKELNLSPIIGINTHCHADHITSTGKMKTMVPKLKSYISKASGADADIHLIHGEEIVWANGTRTLKAIATPGHTDGCMSFVDLELGCVFTGDCLLIDGCGRTDFQGGSSKTLYQSVHNELFALDAGTIVYPGHDYKGRVRSTIGHESKYNSRLTKTLPEYVDLMKNLGLSLPKKLDVAVPANMKCGV